MPRSIFVIEELALRLETFRDFKVHRTQHRFMVAHYWLDFTFQLRTQVAQNKIEKIVAACGLAHPQAEARYIGKVCNFLPSNELLSENLSQSISWTFMSPMTIV